MGHKDAYEDAKNCTEKRKETQGRNHNLLDAIRNLVGKLITGTISGFELSQRVDLPVFSGRVQIKFKLTDWRPWFVNYLLGAR